jgi:hypothetical protein
MVGILAIAASAEGLDPLRRIVAALPVPCAAAIFVVMHIGTHPSVLPRMLDTQHMPADFAKDGEPIQAGRIYVAPSDRRVFPESSTIRLSRGAKVHRTRPAADPLFVVCRERCCAAGRCASPAADANNPAARRHKTSRRTVARARDATGAARSSIHPAPTQARHGS